MIDCSVSPFIDWTTIGGPNYTEAQHRPYRFDPEEPLKPRPDGALLELPTTIGFLGGWSPAAARMRRRLESSVLARLKVVGLLDRTGLLARRWLSPETSTGEDMERLVDACLHAGEEFLQMTFHSCTLLPGATPFVKNDSDQQRLLASIDRVLRHCLSSGGTFRTLAEAGGASLGRRGE